MMKKMEFLLFSRELNQTPGTGGYKPCLVLLRNGVIKQASWLCCGGGDNYEKSDSHHFYPQGQQTNSIDNDVIGFCIIPQNRNQIELKL